MIERNLMNDLLLWKKSNNRKPLILKGVRQCGKTCLLQEFGKRYFENTAYFNFERNEQLNSVFEKDSDPNRIIMELSLLGRQKINPQNTLIIFDEVQTCPKAINSLKYFCEEKPEYALVAAGSLLGITLAGEVGFPVGKVNFLELHPCSFDEFLNSSNQQLTQYIQNIDNFNNISSAICNELAEQFKQYLCLGGMPEVLSTFLQTKDFMAAEKVQDEILKSYELDFSKHAPKNDIAKLFLLWKSIPLQLARENAKFMYGEVKSGARARDLEDALRWLLEAGLIHKISRVEKPSIPLAAYEDRKCFKLYLADTGLLRRLANIPIESILLDDDIFKEYKGRLVENYVLQNLIACGKKEIFYWTSGNTAELDFVIQHKNQIIPVEVKSGLNVRARSLKVYKEKYHPESAIRFSMQDLKKDDYLLNIPLYLLFQYEKFIENGNFL